MSRLERYVGEVLDEKYRLERLLGQGGMGAVYLATHLGTERYVALKLITPQFMRNEEFVERFKREARAAGRLRHPNVVDVTDFGFAPVGTERVAYLVMEYLDGCTLGDVLAEEKQLPLEWVVDILEQVCSAVHEAHLQGIVHRDLKPDNIWLEPNRLGSYRVKVLDFGIAKLAEAGSPVVSGTSGEVMRPAALVNSGANISNSVVKDLDAATLIYAQDVSADPRNEAITQHFAGGVPAEVDAGEDGSPGVQSRMTVLDASGAGATQLMDAPNTEATQMNSAFPGARDTQVVDDVDRTLRFGKTTELGVLGQHTIAQPSESQGAGLTRVGAIMGTPTYMSPEQCRSAHLDARSDIYSLGVIAYQMLVGEPPFKGNTSTVMREHLETTPAPLRARAKKVSKGAAGVVMSTLAKDPADRPQTALAFANSLRARADGVGSMYRRAFSLYSEHFPKFLRLSLIAHIPVIVFTLLLVALTIGEKSLTSRGFAMKVLTAVAVGVVALLQVVSLFIAANVISGMTTVIVTQLSVAPLRPVELRTAIAVLKRRWRPFLNTSIRLTIRIIIGYALFIIPGLVMTVRYSLWAPVVLMEGLSKKAALKRSRELASRSWKTVIAICVLQFVIPFAVSTLVGRISFRKETTAAPTHHVTVSREVTQELSGLINILIMPLMSIVPALLYLKMRQLGGETLTSALEQVEEGEAQRSQWQKRMRSRLSVTPAPGTPMSRPTSRSGG
jgi:serine/threonine protein kinase